MVSGSAEDHAEVRNLYGRYCFALDSMVADDFVECFTENGVMAVGGLGDFEGHEALRGMVENRSPENRSRHQYFNLVIDELSNGQGRARAYFLLLSQSGENIAFGEYDDQLRHERGAWRWTRRDITFLWSSDAYNYGK